MFSARFLRSILKIQRPEEAKRFLRRDHYWCADVAARLIQRSEDLLVLKPREALGLAEIASELVRRMRNADSELQAHAHCALASAQRCTGNLVGAELNFEITEKLAGENSPELNAMIARQKAPLAIEQGNLDLALHLAQEAVALDRQAGVSPAKSLLVEGNIRFFRKEFPESIARWTSVVQQSKPDEDVSLFAMKNMVSSLVRRPLLTSEVVEARKALRAVNERIRGIRETSLRYEVWYTEGYLHMALEEYREAVNHFMQARAGFLRLNMIRDFARASLDLIDVLLKKGEEDRARVTLDRTAKTIAEFDEHRHLANAFRQAQALPIAEATEHVRLHLTSPQGQDSNFS